MDDVRPRGYNPAPPVRPPGGCKNCPASKHCVFYKGHNIATAIFQNLRNKSFRKAQFKLLEDVVIKLMEYKVDFDCGNPNPLNLL